MYLIILKVERIVIGHADTLKDAVRAAFEARLAGYDKVDVVKQVVN